MLGIFKLEKMSGFIYLTILIISIYGYKYIVARLLQDGKLDAKLNNLAYKTRYVSSSDQVRALWKDVARINRTELTVTQEIRVQKIIKQLEAVEGSFK